MDARPARCPPRLRGAGEAGFAAAEWIGAMALAIVVIVLVANVVVVQYVRGAVRLAVDEAARHGAALGRDAPACVEHAEAVLRGPGGVLGGSAGGGIEVRCRRETEAGETVMVAVAEGPLRGLVPVFPDVWILEESRSVVEPAP